MAANAIKMHPSLDITPMSSRQTRVFSMSLLQYCRPATHIRCSGLQFTTPKTGAVGEDRFKNDACPGMYWGEVARLGEEVAVNFNTGSEKVVTTARVGENLLRVAERCGAMTPDLNFCFEGTCCHCEMEVLGGAEEVGYRSNSSEEELIRSCICPVPSGQSSLQVNLISEEDVWGEGVV